MNDTLFIVENTFREKGGPPRHLHYDQDEWMSSQDPALRRAHGMELLVPPWPFV